METIDCIKTRRSVRQFTDQPVSHEELEQIIQLAAYAPSWKNTQTSRFIAVYDRAKLTQLAEECILGFKGNYNTILHAPCLVVLTTVDGRSGYERDGSFTTSKGTHWQSFDAGISAQTLCLAAHQLGLGTVVMGIYDEAKVAQVVGVPEGQSVSALIALGHPAAVPAMPKRKALDTLLSYREG
ncbi:nitroreductase family protein [Acidaminococcus provencensis]|jgi:nitroreductase|uniref:nitroreductase family protein n=1 Tax=Acidaminococcus provencensis TaxID=2058289 RepID=UPI000CF96D90|nr:nitroreductase family protein [Acidaminococcus provencensis]